jgi:lysyl endopeptidase
MLIRYPTLLLLLISLAMRSSGQVSSGGIPASFASVKHSAFIIPVIDMKPVLNEELIREEKAANYHLKPFQFAKSFIVDIDPANSGIWERTGGQKIWCVGIRSKGAYSLNLIFDKMILPKGASLFIYTPNHSKVMGAFTSKNEQSSGFFSMYPIPGDEIVVEYNEPDKVTSSGQIHILKVNHDYKNIFGTRPLGESGLCNRDVYCPDVLQYIKEKQAVVDLLIGGRELCTGTLLNNTSQDKTPYMITAGHCITNTTDAQQTLICFNYESPYCANGKSSLNGYVDQTLNGAILKARSDSLDFALVELETIPPAEFRPFYAGWNKSASIPASSFSIHHPKGDVKKVSIDQNSPTIASFDPDFISNAFWLIGKWEAGTTEAGSSGGPLFNEKKLIVGSLTGGTSTCSDPTDDLFAMFNKQWNHYSSTDQQLKAWLDPNNTGITELSSFNPYDTTLSCSLFSNMAPGESFALQKLGNISGGYISGHNYLKITDYAEKFVQTKQTLLSAVSMGIAKSVSSINNQNSIVKLQVFEEDSIYGVPGRELVSMNLPLNLLSPARMNFINLDNPLVIKGNYYIGYEINYTNSSDTFAVYHTPNRLTINNNKAFAKQNGFWKPFYWIPEIGISTSLLIDSHGCESTLSSGQNPPPGDEVNKFQVLYPQTGISNYVYLKNNGIEEYVKITLYDILGKKLFIQEQMVTSVPRVISLENYYSGVYFLTVQSQKGIQVIKIRINKAG